MREREKNYDKLMNERGGFMHLAHKKNTNKVY